MPIPMIATGASARFHASSLGYPVWWLEAGNYVTGPPPVDTTSLQKQLMERDAARQRSAEAAVPTLTWASHGQSAPGVAAVGAAETAALSAGALLPCLQGCSKEVEDAEYRVCSQACIAQHTV